MPRWAFGGTGEGNTLALTSAQRSPEVESTSFPKISYLAEWRGIVRWSSDWTRHIHRRDPNSPPLLRWCFLSMTIWPNTGVMSITKCPGKNSSMVWSNGFLFVVCPTEYVTKLTFTQKALMAHSRVPKTEALPYARRVIVYR